MRKEIVGAAGKEISRENAVVIEDGEATKSRGRPPLGGFLVVGESRHLLRVYHMSPSWLQLVHR